MQDAAKSWIDYFVTEFGRQSDVGALDAARLHALREQAELAFYRTDAGFLAPEKAAAVYLREHSAPTPATPWMRDLRALTRVGTVA